MLIPISQLLSNRTFLKVPHTPMSASPEPVDHEGIVQSTPSRHTSPSSPGCTGDAAASPPSHFDSRSQRDSLPPPSTQPSLPLPSTHVRGMGSFPAAELLHGIMSSSRAKASDYTDVVNAILVRTMFDYEGLVSTHDAFPGPDLRRQWALRCWKMACKDANEFYNVSDRMCKLVSFSLCPSYYALTNLLYKRSRSVARAFVAMSWELFDHKSSQYTGSVAKSLHKPKPATRHCVRRFWTTGRFITRFYSLRPSL